MKEDKNIISNFGKTLWIYTKYQIFTKFILFFTLFPLFNLISKYLISSSGRVSITSGDYIGFFVSFQGIGFLVASLLVLAVVIGTDINAFIIASALIREKRMKVKARSILVSALKTLKLFLRPSGILVMVYIALVLPLVGIGLSVSITNNFKIPNFITDVIFKNTTYSILYFSLLAILSILTLVFIFFFHYLIIDGQSIGSSLKKSYNLVKRNKKTFIKEFFFKTAFLFALVIAITFGILFVLFNNVQGLSDIFEKRFYNILISLTTLEIFSSVIFMSVPIACHRLTKLFYRLNEENGYEVKLKWEVKADILEAQNKVKLRTKAVFLILILGIGSFNIITSAFTAYYFDEVFKTNKKIDIIAHRAGGNLAAENSLLGLKEAKKNGAKWGEIDVQRTKDGHYIINHDNTFSRLSSENRSSEELTLDEIRRLKIKNLFNEDKEPQPISTLEEFLDEAKGSIGLFIELKGSTADTKMADDVVAMVKKYKMEKEVAILSLDYKIITYIEEKYPNIDTGFLYFFSIGERDKLKGDILIVEEGEATDEKIKEIHRAGKKVIVWTVNSDESIKKFISSDVDGIITDFVLNVKRGMKERDNRSDLEIILDSIFS